MYPQGEVLGVLKRQQYQDRVMKREMIKVAQRNFRQFLRLRSWGWWTLLKLTQPLIGAINMEEVPHWTVKKWQTHTVGAGKTARAFLPCVW